MERHRRLLRLQRQLLHRLCQLRPDRLDLAPDLICNGHRCIYECDADHYHRILKWFEDTEASVRDLYRTGDDWLADYDPRACRWEPFG